MNFTQDQARNLLKAAELFYETDDGEEFTQTLNMNDVWVWASGWGEKVTDEELPEVASLFWMYGWPGVLYWVSKKHDGMRSEFADNNRFIDFVANEERIRKAIPDYNERAFHKESYIIGK